MIYKGREAIEVFERKFGYSFPLEEGESIDNEESIRDLEYDDEPAVLRMVLIDVVKLLRYVGIAESNSAARRLINQGSVFIDDDRITEISYQAYLSPTAKTELHVKCGRQQKVAVFSAEDVKNFQ